ncbi:MULTISPECIES: non-reducing end alpha-L-arabinofuranosidase family hydrolase [unclassified Microbulbifer]|uniref:non-reducing end alpha-L-arabinofuranosidase family hydrolase n=1 Tax=unclassified Microbulbifer TaxID=2619833 RepID=UPI0027E3DA6E|nr:MULTISPECIES: non-reducing end alpha-L-arabinofuranosidase family hydrolase [unclassified Microbulbifer]
MKFDLFRVVFLAAALATAGCSGGKGSEGPDESTPDNNAPPVADAGADLTVTAGNAVTLVGSGSDADGSIASYSWSQVSGASVSLSADGAEAGFTAPAVGESAQLVFELLVTDDDGATSEADSVTVTVLPKQEKFFGTAVEQADDYNQLTVYFDQLTPGNAGKWGSVESTRDQMNWTALDTAYQFAADNGLRYKHHTLIWGQQQPAWMDDLPAEEQLAEIEEWMAALKNRYDEIDMIDVVNEPLHAPPSYKEALGGDGDTGWDWVITAFEMAREHFPDSTLILNDYNILQLREFTEDYLEIIELLQARELIDGIGLQSHFLEQTSAQEVQDNLDRLAATGLPIYVSELDINFVDDARQANKMRELFSVFWQHPAVVGVTHWGYRQGHTWRTEAWLLNSDGTERPALKWLRCYIAGESIAGESGCDALVPEYVPAGWSGDASGVKLEAELYDRGQGVLASGDIVSHTDMGDWILFQGVEFQSEWDSFSINYAKGSGAAGSISVRLDSLENGDTLIVPLPTSGGWGEFDTAEAEWPAIEGTHDVYIRFNEVAGVGNIDWLRFAGAAEEVNQACDLPGSLNWTSSQPLITPKNGRASVKDPTIINYNGQYHVFSTVYDTAYRSIYMNFTDFNQADAADQLNFAPGGRNTVAPQVFYFAPQDKWYLISQWPGKYSTNTDITNPNGWTSPQNLLAGEPDASLDFWVICDDANCYLFFSRDDGALYMSKTTIDNFPNFSGYTTVMSGAQNVLFEASNVYKLQGLNKYLLMVEGWQSGPRFFRAWTSTSLEGPWTPYKTSESDPFAGSNNVSFPGGRWTNDISHGEMIRAGYDQKMEIDACNMQYLYQGHDPDITVEDYNQLPYKLGLLTAN